jgi:hypothetical protein
VTVTDRFAVAVTFSLLVAVDVSVRDDGKTEQLGMGVQVRPTPSWYPPRAVRVSTSVIVTPEGVLSFENAGTKLKSMRLAKVDPSSVSGTAVAPPLAIVIQSPLTTLVLAHPVLKLMGVPVVFPTML